MALFLRMLARKPSPNRFNALASLWPAAQSSCLISAGTNTAARTAMTASTAIISINVNAWAVESLDDFKVVHRMVVADLQVGPTGLQSLDDGKIIHRRDEPGSAGVSPASWCFATESDPPAGRQRSQVRFVESLQSQNRARIGTMNRGPLSRPSATLSPARSGAEGRERRRFMGSCGVLFLIANARLLMFVQIVDQVADLALILVHGDVTIAGVDKAGERPGVVIHHQGVKRAEHNRRVAPVFGRGVECGEEQTASGVKHAHKGIRVAAAGLREAPVKYLRPPKSILKNIARVLLQEFTRFQ